MSREPIPQREAALTAVEATALDELETVIEKGLATFVQVGDALGRIRDARLYRETYSTFEQYLRDRWSLSRSYAYRQIEAAEVTHSLSPIGNTPIPATESVARELAPLKDRPEEMREMWGNVVELHGPKPTAGQVREVVARDGDVLDEDDVLPDQQQRLSKARESRVIAQMGLLQFGPLTDDLVDEGFLDDLERIPHFDYDDFLQELRVGERVLRRLKRSIEERRS